MVRSGDAEHEPPAAGGVDVFAVEDEVGRDLAAVDWSATPLGAPGTWSQSLRTAVSILLSSRFPMWLAWGPELTFFCNSAYRRDTLGRKYPWALGRPATEVWAEIWQDIGPRIETVLTSGKATWDEALLLFLERSGYPEETYHTFSYSPLRDDDGAVVGMLCVVSEDTDRVIGERRMATLRDLGSDPSVVRTDRETLAFSGRQLDRNGWDLPFTLTYLFEDDGSAALAAATGIAPDHPAAPATLAADGRDGPWPIATPAHGESALVALDGPVFAGLPNGAWDEPPTQALLAPLQQQGAAPHGFVVVGLNRYRPLDEGYRGFVELVAGHVAAGIAAARSYQAQQRRAEELAELDRAKTAFFSNISHEFRTPLTLIMGPVEELRDRLAHTDVRASEELEVVRRNGLRLGKLVNTLLDFSRIEAGRMQARYEPVDLAAATAELAGVFRSAIDKAGLTYVVDCPPLPEPVLIDRGMWEKVVLNLLSNALKFTFAGSVGISVRAEGGEAVVTVEDTGIGVPAEEMPRLFERFHRIENVRARSNEGSGIGLALVQELVGLHGGTIVADSEQGRGTRFTIRLRFGSAHLPAGSVAPATSPAAVSATADPYLREALRWLPEEDTGQVIDEVAWPHAGSGTGQGPKAPATVLVADDNADMREYLTRLLTGAGYAARTVADGVEALEAVRTRPPDLVVSDVMMPRLDGLALVAALRADPRTAAVPVLLLSARAGQEASIEGLQAGADDYLVKPFAAAELLARVRANVELSRLRNHHARWRTALIDSLQEAFFVCDEDGTVIEVNSAFADILGYGPDGLPYAPAQPWWPDAATDPEGHRQVAEAFSGLRARRPGSYTIPVNHRDGRRLWLGVTFNPAEDPDTGRTVVVGTFRDVTAEHHAIQRDNALAALSIRLSEASSLSEAVAGALAEFRDLWRARGVAAVVFTDRGAPALTATDPELTWDALSDHRREGFTALRERPGLSPVTDGATGVGITLEHPEGTMVLRLDLDEDRPFSAEDELLLSLLSGHLAQGLTRAHQIDQQRETALALQRAILGPSSLPEGFAVRYEPAARPLEIGGDWYDTVALSEGRIGIVVGDCVGRGLKAAAVMGQLRSACRALLLQEVGPARTLMALDHFAASLPGAMCTTVFCGVLNPETGLLTYSSAGHPPAILAHPDGATGLLDQGRSVPLAVRPGAPRPEAECTVPPRATLLMYTDGLVERRRRPLTVGIDEAGEAVQQGREAALDDLASQVMARLAPDGGYDDDVALLLYRHPVPLDLTFAAESGQLAPVRQTLRSWLTKCGLPPQTVQSVLVAAGEACANAIEHGYRGAPGEAVRLRAEALVGDLYLKVADAGRWKTPEPELNAHRGRGVAVMRAMMEQVTVTPGPAGTTVDMHLRIPR
ncbi:SpoIIE family protein phosphatase [Actinosynnema sp. NPDC047251]|uniref:histidine kinase n=1 Tax=Saccharothrix espanaensis (strain ATCC 51144 / DSM 44229 / JCM 9112 / NBRC 15066 / NRRL 15764) TaxID=1179773 RepID=K0JUX1_SACES|nr:SpoIIE family protein phosphatase [Saccharothrix espanaensis]CCH31635.1 PAS/PAC sensor hybrid histidine kinase [Saccharothrix espanaensis DSM 44229]